MSDKGRGEPFFLEMQIHWNEFRRDVRLSQYCGAKGKEEKASPPPVPPPPPPALLPSPSPSPSFIFTLNPDIVSSLSRLIHREGIFRVNFLTVPSDIPRASIYIFVGPSTSPSSSSILFVFPLPPPTHTLPTPRPHSTPNLVPTLLETGARNGRSRFPAINCRYSTHFAVTIPNAKLK